MGFEISPEGQDVSRWREWIGYEPPTKGLGRRTLRLAAAYAHRCVQQMIGDAADHFGLVPGA